MEAFCVGGAQYLYSCLCVAFLKYSNLEGLVTFSVSLDYVLHLLVKTGCEHNGLSFG